MRTELVYEEEYWEYIINHPCHAALPSNAEEDAIAPLVWYAQGSDPPPFFFFHDLIIMAGIVIDRLLDP